MELKNHKLSGWYNLYSSEKIVNIDFDDFIRNIDNEFPGGSFYNLPQTDYKSLIFKSQNSYGYENLNIYTLLSIINILMKQEKRGLFGTRRKKILFVVSDQSIFDERTKNAVIRFLNLKHHVYSFTNKCVNEFIIDSTIDSMHLDYGFYLSYDQVNGTYHLKIYRDKNIIEQDELEKIKHELLKHQKNFMLSLKNDFISLNVDKVIDVALTKSLKRFENKTYQFKNENNFNVYTMIDDNLTEYILNRFFTRSNIKYLKLSPLLNKDLLGNSKLAFLKWLRRTNYKADIILIIDKINNIKLIVRTKKTYLTLNEDQIAYLYINSEYLHWKQSGQLENTNFIIPVDASEIVINLLKIFKIDYSYENDPKDINNVIFSYNRSSFSNSTDHKLNYENFNFLFNLLFALRNYKDNNNLFTYKISKMEETIKNLYTEISYINRDLDLTQEWLKTLYGRDKYSRKLLISSIEDINFDNGKMLYLAKFKIKSKFAETTIFVSYNKMTKNIEFKYESRIKQKTGLWLIQYFYFLTLKNKIERIYKRELARLKK
ncbi:hypothetical protein H9M94_02700 [Mycoplasma sp. Pen4]|uniref:MAG5620 family putative phospho-sugar mutase n=1 Tax=Mycoplasma sp. Pen4 TaxID=640330 RepID=UPI0016540063|nr:hypothetical protein [Mycoplasma sp. Pen4]QNM93495.1 hypothetical protein H9M94_02700 [Mycoplasma sp. Pen4]